MFSLDPAKLLIIAVVALAVLGPDKLPAAARKISSLLKDLQKMRTSLEAEAKKYTADLPFGAEMRSARETIGKVTSVTDPRQALYRAAGLSSVTGEGQTEGDKATGVDAVPGSIDLSPAEPTQTTRKRVSSEAAVGAGPFATVSAGSSPNAASINDPSQN